MPTWPAALPQRPIIAGSGAEEETNIVAAPADVGIGQVRRRYTGQGQFPTYSFRMSEAQVADFWTWFHDSATGLAGGVLPYDWTDPILGTTQSFQLVPQSRPRTAPARGKRTIVTLQLYRHPA
jgi:hypothetical protein